MTSQSFDRPTKFDLIARPYRWLEYLTFGPMLERCRFHFLPDLNHARRALILGDGDGRFLARLLAANPLLHADVVDLSPAMLNLLATRVAGIAAQTRITLHRTDARDFTPPGIYDLVVTHFFLDCFTTEELLSLAARIQPHLSPSALWVISEFAIPAGPMSRPAKLVVRSLYGAFGVLTGLPVRRLPDNPAALTAAGLSLKSRRGWLGDLLVSELWESPGNQPHLDKLQCSEAAPFNDMSDPNVKTTTVPGFDPAIPPYPGPDPGTDDPPNPIPAPEPDPEPPSPAEPQPRPEPTI